MEFGKFSCFKCPDRHVGCHGSCEKYAADKKDYESQKRNQMVEKRAEDAYMTTRFQMIKKAGSFYDPFLKEREENELQRQKTIYESV